MMPNGTMFLRILMLLALSLVSSAAIAQESSCTKWCEVATDFANTFFTDPATALDDMLGQDAPHCRSLVPKDYKSPPDEARNLDLSRMTGLTAACRMESRITASVFLGKDAGGELRRNTVRITFTDSSGSESVCTGVFLSIEYILTAGHCSCGQISSYLIQYQHDTAPVADGFRLSALQIVRFDGYSCDVANDPNAPDQIGRDLALLRVDPDSLDSEVPDPIKIVSMIDLARAGITPRLAIVGYGKTEAGILPDRLKFGYSTVRDAFCQRGFYRGSVCAMFREFVMSSTLEHSDVLGVDSCGGDSGGPVFQIRKSEVPGKAFDPILIGLTSRGLSGVVQDNRLICGGGGIYTAVGTKPVLDWLDSQGIHIR